MVQMELLKPRTQSEKILAKLQEAGEAGVNNIELNKIAFRYSARLHDLRKDGYIIKATHIINSCWNFRLIDPITPDALKAADDWLVKGKYNG